LREAGQQEVYIRKDPDSVEAYYNPELPNVHTNVGATYKGLQFIWDRHKGNENLEHGFTHYLTRLIYCDDPYRILDGSKIGKDTLKIRVDEKDRTGILCLNSFDLAALGRRGTQDELQKVILIIRQITYDNNCIRLITAYPTVNLKYLRLYWKNLTFRIAHGTKRPDRLDKEDLKSAAFREQYKVSQKTRAEWERADEANKIALEEVLDEFVTSSVNAAKEFIDLIKKRTMPQLSKI
jgi:hypothetical protein